MEAFGGEDIEVGGEGEAIGGGLDWIGVEFGLGSGICVLYNLDCANSVIAWNINTEPV